MKFKIPKKYIRYFFILALIALIAIQFIVPDTSVPKVDDAKDFITVTQPPEQIKTLLKAACYDCHSYKTKYPWYNKIQPVAFWLDGHIDNGRKHLNFSIWGDYSQKKADHKLEECVEYVEEKRMPLFSYTWTHGDARLSEEDRKMMVDWFQSLR